MEFSEFIFAFLAEMMSGYERSSSSELIFAVLTEMPGMKSDYERSGYDAHTLVFFARKLHLYGVNCKVRINKCDKRSLWYISQFIGLDLNGSKAELLARIYNAKKEGVGIKVGTILKLHPEDVERNQSVERIRLFEEAKSVAIELEAVAMKAKAVAVAIKKKAKKEKKEDMIKENLIRSMVKLNPLELSFIVIDVKTVGLISMLSINNTSLVNNKSISNSEEKIENKQTEEDIYVKFILDGGCYRNKKKRRYRRHKRKRRAALSLR